MLQNRAFCSFSVRHDAKILRIMQVIAQKAGELTAALGWHISCKSMGKWRKAAAWRHFHSVEFHSSLLQETRSGG
jgi:hypothetical protein